MKAKYLWQRVKNFYHFFKTAFYVLKYGYPAGKLYVIGVTGTDGKTTTSTLIYELLKKAGFKAALLTTVGARIGDREIDTGFHTTNPDAKTLQPILTQMVKEGVTHLVLEVTAHGLDQFRVMGCNFSIGVLTNLTHEHLDDFVDMKRYARAKLKLFNGVKYAILNSRDDSFEFFKTNIAENNPEAKIFGYKESKIRTVNPSLKGEYNRQNIGAVEMVAQILRIDGAKVKEVVEDFEGIPGRREEVEMGQDFKVYVDFAHTPNALERVLTQLRHELVNGKKLVVVFGATGERDKLKRPKMGEAAARLADLVIITSDDSRREDQDEIYSQIVSGIKQEEKSKKVIKENDRRKAIKMAITKARSGDIVLLAGKGHERSILIGTIEREWSDSDEAKRAILSLKL